MTWQKLERWVVQRQWQKIALAMGIWSCLWYLMLPRSSFAAPPIASIELKKDVALLWLEGEYRPRFELYQQRDLRNPTDTNGAAKDRYFINQRARLAAGILLWNQVTVFVQVQDVRNWGSEANTLDFSAEGFDLHQGWFEIKAWDIFAIKVGRMELVYDNERLIGSLGWAQQGRSFDAIQMRLEPKSMQFSLTYAKLSDSGGQPDTDHQLAIAWFRWREWKFFRPSVYYILQSNPSANKLVRHTLGVHLTGTASGLTYTGEFFIQPGTRDGGGTTQDLLGWMGAVSLQYQIKVPTKPTFVVWAEFLSGNSGDPNDTTIRSFDTLFGTNHGFYGFADFFLDIPTNTRSAGLMDMGVGFRIWPAKGLLLRLDFHYFRLFGTLNNTQGQAVQELGPELDFLVKYVMFKGHVVLTGGYSLIIPIADQAYSALGKGNEVEHWAFFMTSAKF